MRSEDMGGVAPYAGSGWCKQRDGRQWGGSAVGVALDGAFADVTPCAPEVDAGPCEDGGGETAGAEVGWLLEGGVEGGSSAFEEAAMFAVAEDFLASGDDGGGA